MGTAGSVNKEPRSPYHRKCEAVRRKAKSMRYVDGQASEFYFLCANGETDKVRQILEAPNRQPIDELVKLEPNGNTALHVAAERGHGAIVKLLLDHRCSRTILNRKDNKASEEATASELHRVFSRSECSDRFHDSDTTKSMVHCLPKTSEAAASSTETKNFFELFESDEEIYKYSLDHQTTAMWVKLFDRLIRTFPYFLQNDNLKLDTFHLHKNADFQEFLRKKLGPKYEETLNDFDEAQRANSIEPLLTIYSKEGNGFYRVLNGQLADSPLEPDTSPHLCDRFIIEFHIRGDELAHRAFIGTAYRGATIKSEELSFYEMALAHKPRGVIVFKAFTSTSEDKDIALEFILGHPPQRHETGVLFIIETKVKSLTVIGIADVSDYKAEKEILFMPGNLFIVQKVVRDVTIYTKQQQRLTITEIYLEYLHVPVSSWKKIWHTVQSANNSVTSTEVTPEVSH